uniref:Protein kinase domain-containing protein n=1 Tax=Araucaria cunninghamii TaxID=56994 RepID=A0A0D6R5L4_ARACU
MMTAETGTYRWMAPELYSTVTLRHGEKKHYNHKVDLYSFAIVLWELLTNRMPFEGMSNLQAAYAAAFKNVRPSLEGLPEELASVLQACWAEDPNMRPNFTQTVRRLNAFLSALPGSENIPPDVVTASKNSILPPESPGTSSLMGKQGDQSEDSNGKSTNKSCFLPCFSHCFQTEAENGLME